ncbi:MAG: hypothetical protein GY716_04330 [bacterium]|nr:hypothetical protein [bacterium]
MRLRRSAMVAGLAAVLAAAVLGAHASDRVFVVTSDPPGGSGSSTVFDLDAPWAASVDVEPTGFNTVVRRFFGRLYVVHPQTGEVQVIDPSTLDTVLTFSVGAGSAPRDILVVDAGSAYVSRSADNLLYEVDPATGDLLDTVDLGDLADADGVPDMSMMALDGRRLFVQLQRLDAEGIAVPPSYLAVVDVDTNQLIDADPERKGVQGIALTGSIPAHKMQIEGRRLYVSEPGTFHDGTGGIDEIDLDSLTALGYLTSEAQLALNITGFVLTSPVKGYALTHTDLLLSSHLQPFNRADGSILKPELDVTFAQVDSLAHDPATDQLFFLDHDINGVRVFDATTQVELTTTPIGTGGDPVDLVILRDEGPGAATGLRVDSIDGRTGEMSLAYTPACAAADHTIVFGALEHVGLYGYSGQVCGVGNGGAIPDFDPGAGSFFFLVVGNDGDGVEGSYGTDSGAVERPEDHADPGCALVQDLALRCD